MTIEVNKIGVNNTVNSTQTNNTAAFRRTTAPISDDTVELSLKKKGLSNTAKWGIGIGTLATIVGLGFLLVKKTNKAHKKLVDNIKQLCDEKLKISNLPEKIEFKPNDNLEDSIKFANEVLGIKKVDKNFTPYALNNTLKAIVDVSNLHKGKVFMPTELEFKATDYTTAEVYKNVFNNDFGKMVINPKYFDNCIGELIELNTGKIYIISITTETEETFNKPYDILYNLKY